MTRLVTYNVNGIRSALTKGLLDWLRSVEADVVCLQEIKSTAEQAGTELFESLGYHCHWFPAEKKGYSGTALLSKTKPQHVEYGCGIPAYDAEGRCIRADFADFSVMSLYAPSGSSGEDRQAFKFQFMDDWFPYIQDLKTRHPHLIISGDYNICHRPIDIHNPKSNANSSGFLPEERAWMEKLMTEGWVDTFRVFNDQPHQYTWWSFRANARAKNLGWRIDYHLATEAMRSRLTRSVILPEARHSDHCPVLLEID